MDVICVHCNALHWDIEKVTSSRVGEPRFGSCCDHGKVRLPLLADPPSVLRGLLLGRDTVSRNFRDDIRQYNMALAFTSLGVKQDGDVNYHGGWVFRIHGQLSHLVGDLLPVGDVAPQFAQLYILDSADALGHRMERNSNLRSSVMSSLQSMLETHHSYSHKYKHAFEILSRHDPNWELRLRVLQDTDRRRYNLPTGEEVAVILPGDGSATDHRDIILRCRHQDGPALQRIHEGHPAYAPLHYVLLFPYGEHGWNYDMRLHDPARENPGRLTLTRHTAFRIHDRRCEFSVLLRGGKLFQQYLVDMWAAAEQARLSFLRNNQGLLRASLYSGLQDAVAQADNAIPLDSLGTRYVLPSTHIGSPRHMQQRFQDAMAVARYYRKVDLFITVTANP
ncbi:hypothetical protein BDN72DRAFT_746666, partial [Pluteus cervinus]